MEYTDHLYEYWEKRMEVKVSESGSLLMLVGRSEKKLKRKEKEKEKRGKKKRERGESFIRPTCNF